MRRQGTTTQKIAQNSITQSRVNTQPRLTATLSPTRELQAKITHWHPRDLIAVCAVETRPSTESRALLTNQIHKWYMLFSQRCGNVVLPSFTRSERFLQVDKLITRLQRDEHTATCCGVMTNSVRLSTGNVFVNVMESDAVFWWAAIFRREWRGREGGGKREEGG